MRKKGFSADYADLAVACLSFSVTQKPVAGSLEPGLLNYADRRGLTLHLAECLPPHPELQSRLQKNRLRLARLREEAARILGLLEAAGLRGEMMKGFVLEPHFVRSAELRVQYDLDLFLSPEDAAAAHRLLRERGYDTLGEESAGPAIHLPTLIRKTGWEWRGDFFDPDIPIGIELHSRLWTPEYERIPLDWTPRRPFTLADHLACVALHLMRHFFRGSLRLSHLYELAYFLEHHAGDAGFWQAWPHTPLMTTAFLLASHVFHCRLPADLPAAPAGVTAWLNRFSCSVFCQERAGKCQTLLQMVLIQNWRDRVVVLRRRLLPLRLPGPVDAVYLPKEQLTLKRRLLSQARLAKHLLRRASHHLRSSFGFAWAAARWLWDLA